MMDLQLRLAALTQRAEAAADRLEKAKGRNAVTRKPSQAYTDAMIAGMG